jgi:catechol 2,3-dioxygenase-like lactoylglutathione lyase family enzyme
VLETADLVAFAPTLDLERAQAFYGTTLGLAVLETTPPFAIVFDAHGTQLRVTKVPALSVHPFTVLGWRVPDIAASVAQLRVRGIEVNRYDGFGQDEDGVWTAPGGTRIAWFNDPDGNNLSLEQPPTP